MRLLLHGLRHLPVITLILHVLRRPIRVAKLVHELLRHHLLLILPILNHLELMIEPLLRRPLLMHILSHHLLLHLLPKRLMLRHSDLLKLIVILLSPVRLLML